MATAAGSKVLNTPRYGTQVCETMNSMTSELKRLVDEYLPAKEEGHPEGVKIGEDYVSVGDRYDLEEVAEMTDNGVSEYSPEQLEGTHLSVGDPEDTEMVVVGEPCKKMVLGQDPEGEDYMVQEVYEGPEALVEGDCVLGSNIADFLENGDAEMDANLFGKSVRISSSKNGNETVKRMRKVEETEEDAIYEVEKSETVR